MRAVNLLPREETRRSFEAGRGVVFGAVGGTALATAVLASMILSASGSLNAKRGELDTLRAQIAAIPQAPVKDTSDEDAFAAEKSARIGALSAALSGRVAWDRVLRHISLVLPEDVWLKNLGTVAPDLTAPTPTTGLTLTGSTYSQNGVARFLSRLAVIPGFANVRLQVSQSEMLDERELVQFTIVADVRSPSVAPPVAPATTAPATGAAS